MHHDVMHHDVMHHDVMRHGAGGLPRAAWGQRGYDERAVDALLRRVHDTLQAAEHEVADLHGEVQRLHRYIRRLWDEADAADAQPPAAPGGVPVVDRAPDRIAS